MRKSPTREDEADVPLLLESEAGCLEVMEARETLEPSVVALVGDEGKPEGRPRPAPRDRGDALGDPE